MTARTQGLAHVGGVSSHMCKSLSSRSMFNIFRHVGGDRKKPRVSYSEPARKQCTTLSAFIVFAHQRHHCVINVLLCDHIQSKQQWSLCAGGYDCHAMCSVCVPPQGGTTLPVL
ncbi:uncharacterized protein V6R79_003068 [Siganus canaliculatus]